LSSGDEAHLLQRVAATGDSTALGILFERYAPRFLSALRRRGLRQADAEDVVQNCFLRLLGAGDLLNHVTSPRAYLWRMVLNGAHDRMAAGRKWTSLDTGNSDDELSSIQEAELATTEEPDLRLDIDHCVDRAWSLLQANDPERAQALEWAIVDELSSREIAQLLERSYGATREYLSQCRKVFRTLLASVCPDWQEEAS
jgi:RNA polymerase sigma-70 factor (ECF subfamily)